VEVIGDATLYLGDALEILPTLDRVNHIIVDPPYFRVKNEDWDRQWSSRAEFLEWIGTLVAEFERILASNGSLYMFASPQMAGGVECEIGKRFNVLNQIVWRKGKPLFGVQGWSQKAKKEDLRQFVPQTERIVFAEHYGASKLPAEMAEDIGITASPFELIRKYIETEWSNAGLKKRDANAACGFSPNCDAMASRFYFHKTEFQLPTSEHYQKMRDHANRHGGDFLSREYEDLRREYEDLRRPFNVSADCQWGDVWDFDPVQGYPGKHPCEKPIAMMGHIIRSSTREGDVILDCFAGSGSTGEAALKLGRKAILIEKDPKWFDHACERLDRLETMPDLFAAVTPPKPKQDDLWNAA
jgi:site-specific DNA-methyltransferase (adenine-specific)